MLCITDNQTRGRGRYERKWVTKPGVNLTFTLVFKPNRHDGLHVLTLACALASIEVFEHYLEEDFAIKWPNDLYCNNRKMGGILTESIFSGNTLDRVLVGIGLNINQQTFNESIQDKATSLALEADGKSFDREPILIRILNRIEYYYQQWNRFEINLLKSINHRLIGYGQWVTFKVYNETYEEKCKFLGINQDGCLVALTSDDEIETFSYEQVRIITD